MRAVTTSRAFSPPASRLIPDTALPVPLWEELLLFLFVWWGRWVHWSRSKARVRAASGITSPGSRQKWTPFLHPKWIPLLFPLPIGLLRVCEQQLPGAHSQGFLQMSWCAARVETSRAHFTGQQDICICLSAPIIQICLQLEGWEVHREASFWSPDSLSPRPAPPVAEAEARMSSLGCGAQ